MYAGNSGWLVCLWVWQLQFVSLTPRRVPENSGSRCEYRGRGVFEVFECSIFSETLKSIPLDILYVIQFCRIFGSSWESQGRSSKKVEYRWCTISCQSTISLQFIYRNFEMILIKKTSNKNKEYYLHYNGLSLHLSVYC